MNDESTENEISESAEREGGPIEVTGASEDEKKYYQSVYGVVNQIYAQQFPELYQAGLVSRLEFSFVPPEDGQPYLTAAEFDRDSKAVKVMTGNPISAFPSAPKDKVETGIEGVQAQRIVVDATTMAHEYTHAIYEALLPSEEKPPKSFVPVDNMMSEGLSMMMGYLFIDALRREPELLDLDQQGIEDLELYRSSYLKSLRHFDQSYTQGTLNIFHKVFVDAAGPPDSRNVGMGVLAMKDFVSYLDRSKLLSTSTGDPHFQELVKASNVDQISSEFSAVKV